MASAMRIGVDLTACWRPRVGMVTASLELTRALLEQGGDEFVLLASRERPAGLSAGGSEAILSPYRHELLNKLAWMAPVEAGGGLDAILYPYWPSPPGRRPGAPPAAIFVHDLAFKVRPQEVPWQQRVYLGLLLPRALSSAAAVLVPSQATRTDLLECYRLPGLAERVHVVPEGPTDLGAKPAQLPAGLEPGFILSVGTLETRKNHLRLLDAYQALRAARTRTPELVIAGKPGWGSQGREISERLASAEGVQLLGHVDDATLLALYRNAGLLAFPSLYEGFGLPLLEAMREGLPALVGSRGALPELAGGAALGVEATDARSIRAGLEQLLDDAGLRTQLAAKARARAAEFSWAEAAQRTSGILHAIA